MTLVLGITQVLPARLFSSMSPMKMRNPAVFQEHASTTHRAGCLVYPLIRTVRGKWCWLVSLGCWWKWLTLCDEICYLGSTGIVQRFLLPRINPSLRERRPSRHMLIGHRFFLLCLLIPGWRMCGRASHFEKSFRYVVSSNYSFGRVQHGVVGWTNTLCFLFTETPSRAEE